MTQNIFDEGIYDVGLAFGFDFQPVEPNVAHETCNLVARRDATNRLTKEYALNDSANFEISSLAHGTLPSSYTPFGLL